MPKIVADTNVYISAILFGGKAEKILQMAMKGQIQLYISPDILAEIAAVLRKKFGWSSLQVAQVDLFIRDLTVVVTPPEKLTVIKEDDADNRILECALEAKAYIIVSGDRRHLLKMGKYEDIWLVSPAEFIDLFQGGRQG